MMPSSHITHVPQNGLECLPSQTQTFWFVVQSSSWSVSVLHVHVPHCPLNGDSALMALKRSLLALSNQPGSCGCPPWLTCSSRCYLCDIHSSSKVAPGCHQLRGSISENFSTNVHSSLVKFISPGLVLCYILSYSVLIHMCMSSFLIYRESSL